MTRTGEAGTGQDTHVDALTQGSQINVPVDHYIANADFLRDGQDLILRAPDGEDFVIENYFSAMPPPTLVNNAGAGLSPDMVRAFVQPAHEAQRYARAGHAENDESPIGLVSEVKGNATITRGDGTIEKITQGMEVYEGDVVETEGDAAVNIIFIDETSFAVSQNARLAIDEYVFDPASGSGTQSFSVLRGMFVFVSGMIGREDPDDVEISTPIGNIGIRGTTIAGNVDSGTITVIEGAIVLRTLDGQHETTLATQFETARFDKGGTIENLGVQDGETIALQFGSMQAVAGAFFAGIGQTQPAPAQDHSPQHAPAPAPAPAEIVPPGGYNETSFDGGQDAGFGKAAAGTPTPPSPPSPQTIPVQTAPPAATIQEPKAPSAPAEILLNQVPLPEPVIAAPPPTVPSIVTPSPSTDVNITITTTGTYNGGAGDDQFAIGTRDFGTINGGAGYDRITINPGFIGGSPIEFSNGNVTGVEEINAINGVTDYLIIGYTYDLTAQNVSNLITLRTDSTDSISLNLQEEGFHLTNFNNNSITLSDGTHSIVMNGATLANVTISNLELLRPGTLLANGLTFSEYDDNGLLIFTDSSNTQVTLDGPLFDNVRLSGTTNDTQIIFDDNYFVSLGGGNDTLIAQANNYATSFFDGGDGHDRFLFEGSGSLDLSVLGTANLMNFEEIGFQSLGVQTIRLSMAQIFQLMEQSQTSNQLYITDSAATGLKTLEVSGGDLATLADSVTPIGPYTEYMFDIGGTIHTLVVAENITVAVV